MSHVVPPLVTIDDRDLTLELDAPHDATSPTYVKQKHIPT